jgi:hypothetical protein
METSTAAAEILGDQEEVGRLELMIRDEILHQVFFLRTRIWSAFSSSFRVFPSPN